VNESFGAETTEFLNARLQMPVPDTIEATDYPEEDSEPRPRREGLPPSFRMRHDRHYVEELMSTPPDHANRAAAPALAMSTDRAAVGEGALETARPARQALDRRAAADADLVASRLEAVVAHSAVSRCHAVAPDLVARSVQAELQRVARLARGVAVSRRDGAPQRRPVAAGDIAAAVRSACARVARFNGAECTVSVDDAAFTIAAERALLVQAVAGTVDALLELAWAHADDSLDDPGPRIAVSLRAVKIRPALIVDVACSGLSLPATLADRFFDNRDDDYTRAPASGILLASAAHVARMHGGRADLKTQSEDGLTVTCVFPQEAPRASQ
jgi:hypothetical protein